MPVGEPLGTDDAAREEGLALARELAARIEADPALRARLAENANAELEALGVPVPPEVVVRVVMNEGDTLHLVIPPDPRRQLDDAALDRVVGGAPAGGGVFEAFTSLLWGLGLLGGDRRGD